MPALPVPHHDNNFSFLERPAAALSSIRVLVRSPPSDPSGERRNWIIIAAVAAALLFLTLGGIAFLALLRRRRQRRQVFKRALLRDPHLTRNEFARWRKMSDLEREQAEERQRTVMIHKSLASRSSHSLRGAGSGADSSIGNRSLAESADGASSIRSGSIRSLGSTCSSAGTPSSLRERMNSSVGALLVDGERTAGSCEEGEGRRSASAVSWPRRQLKLRDEWKEWESGLLTQRTLSGEIHPVEVVLPTVPPLASPKVPTGRKVAAMGSPVPSPTLPLLPRSGQAPYPAKETSV